MEKFKRGLSVLLLAGVLTIVGVSAISTMYADEGDPSGCGQCQCFLPNNPQGSQYGVMQGGACSPCKDCYILLN